MDQLQQTPNVENLTVEHGNAEDALQNCKPILSPARKLFISCVVTMAMFNSTISSSLPGGASPYISDYFNVSDPSAKLLPSTVYLVGYIVGPLLLSPMSEEIGRRPILLLASALFFVSSIACALSPNFATLVVFRFFAGAGGSAPISIIGGVLADIYEDPAVRGTATAAYTVFTTVGTVLGPAVCGGISIYGWRWSFWLTTILSGLVLVGLWFIPETYAPYLLRKKTAHARSMGVTGLPEPRPLREVLLTAISRPMFLLATEKIVLFSSMYCALVFAVLFLLFPGYQYIFHDIYGMTYDKSGLAFVAMAVGTVLSFAICVAYDKYRQAKARQGLVWAETEEYRRLPLACIGGPFLVLSLFWLAWTSSPNIHWIVPMLSGVPFAIGLNLILVALFNYLTDSYGRYAASALAAASCSRSIGGAVLPLATHALFTRLGVGWALTIIGGFSLLLVPIPFLFIMHGGTIRARSPFCVSAQKSFDNVETSQVEAQDGTNSSGTIKV